MQPNIFKFATSELSQDAFLCWLLSWVDPKHKQKKPHLHEISTTLPNLIYNRARTKPPTEISTIEIKRQFKNIDIFCTINNKTAIIIEDKLGTKQHSNQLAKYKDHAIKNLRFAIEDIILVYIQTGDQCDYGEVYKNGYCTITRKELLDIFESPIGKNAKNHSEILYDFSENLRQTEDDVQSYLTLPPQKWSWNSWKGFYSEIKQQIPDGKWDYVANPSGGFLGFWWHIKKTEDCDIYLQLEQDRLCFKVSVDEEKNRRNIRNHWHKQIMNKCPEYDLRAKRPDRFGHGQYMTVAILDQDYRAERNNIIDLAETIKTLTTAQLVIDSCLPEN